MAFCPIQNMLADFFTKLLQGSMFVRMREKILNLPVNANTDVHRSVLGNKKNNEEKLSGKLTGGKLIGSEKIHAEKIHDVMSHRGKWPTTKDGPMHLTH